MEQFQISQHVVCVVTDKAPNMEKAVSLNESQDFKDLFKSLCPSYNLPARKTLGNTMLNIRYKELLGEVKAKVGKAKAICLTSDGWTDINESFFAATAHYINDADCTLHSFLLELGQFSKKHTSENIAAWLKTVMVNFGISEKVCCVVTDNAPNMKCAVNLLRIENITCFAHTLNIIVQNSIRDSMLDTVNSVKHIVSYFKKSSTALLKLHELQKNMNYVELKLILDVPTRWNSTVYMLERFHLNQEPIISCLAILGISSGLEESDWIIMKEASTILKNFDLITKEMSAEKTITLPKMRVIVSLLINKLKSNLNSGDFGAKGVILLNLLLKGLLTRFQFLDNSTVSQATVLDPRFKHRGCKDNDTFKQCCDIILNEMTNLGSTQEVTLMNEVLPNESVENANSIWDEFDSEQNQPQLMLHTRSSFRIELDDYLSEALCHRNDDPLQWWKIHKMKYPTLYELLLKKLCIPASSVPCERIFSKAEDIETSKRNRLKANKINKILFIKHNSS
uniref:HAT C-terminal dimerisation domain-containing protein n=1 Tax=Anopheles minimus TaxID=112268 RepID=A0A182W808_9DIPT